jgi:predicted Zn-dependent protease
VLVQEEDYVGAHREFDQAITAAPTLVTALAGRAACAYEQGDPAAAIADLSRAVDLDPDNPALRFNRAVAIDRWDESVMDLNMALAAAPEDEDIQEALVRSRARVAAVG